MGSKEQRLKDSKSWLPLFIWAARDEHIEYSRQFPTSPKLYLTPASKYQHFQAVIFGASKPSMAASCGLEDTSSWISEMLARKIEHPNCAGMDHLMQILVKCKASHQCLMPRKFRRGTEFHFRLLNQFHCAEDASLFQSRRLGTAFKP